MVNEIYTLELEIKKAMYKHSELLSLCTSMQLQVDEIVKKSKLSTLRNSFDFRHAMRIMMENDTPEMLEYMITPLFQLNIKKWFPLTQMEDLLSLKTENQEAIEKISLQEEEAYVYEDEIEEKRIQDNFHMIVKVLLDKLNREAGFSLQNLNEELEIHLGSKVLFNADYYTFLVHMCQKDCYSVKEIKKKPDTFFEEILHEVLLVEDGYTDLIFSLERKGEETVKITDVLEISDIWFEKVEI